jgi:hypothetical protein
VRRGKGTYGAQGGKYGTDAPHLIFSPLRLAFLVHYALQRALLVLWQLIVPAWQRLFEIALQGVLPLVRGKLLIPRHPLVPHCSVVTDAVEIRVLIWRTEQRPVGPTRAARAA